MPTICYIKRADLDIQKWDACIEAAPNGLIYAYSFYLDAMCDNWDALVLNDYEAVMPLPWRKKWGVRYVYQPPFIQRLGIFGATLSDQIQKDFFKNAVARFPYIHFNVTTLPNINNISSRERKNFVVDLSKGYNQIIMRYTKDCIKNIRKADKRGCYISNKIEVAEVIESFKNVYGSLNKKLNTQIYDRFGALVRFSLQHNKALLYGVKDENKTLLYSAVLFSDNKRLYYILGSPTARGREFRAPYFFIDFVLKSYGGQNLLFDFEGSDIPNVAFFYQKFTSTKEYYHEVKINSLPLMFKWLKK